MTPNDTQRHFRARIWADRGARTVPCHANWIAIAASVAVRAMIACCSIPVSQGMVVARRVAGTGPRTSSTCEGATLEDFRGGGVLPSHNI